jgi:hypothetical protein
MVPFEWANGLQQILVQNHYLFLTTVFASVTRLAKFSSFVLL